MSGLPPHPAQSGYAYPPLAASPPGWMPMWYPIPPGYPGYPGWAPSPLPPHPTQPYLAGASERVAAHLIDLIIVITIAAVLCLPLLMMSDVNPLRDPWTAVVQLQTMANVIIVVLPFVAGLVYALLTEGRTGQTLGKRLVGIRVVKVDGRPIGKPEALIRWLCFTVDTQFLILGLILIVTRPLKQRVGDLAAGTVVVRT